MKPRHLLWLVPVSLLAFTFGLAAHRREFWTAKQGYEPPMSWADVVVVITFLLSTLIFMFMPIIIESFADKEEKRRRERRRKADRKALEAKQAREKLMEYLTADDKRFIKDMERMGKE